MNPPQMPSTLRKLGHMGGRLVKAGLAAFSAGVIAYKGPHLSTRVSSSVSACVREKCGPGLYLLLDAWEKTRGGGGDLGGNPFLRPPAGSQNPGPLPVQAHLPCSEVGRTQGSPKPEATVSSPPSSFFFRPDLLLTPCSAAPPHRPYQHRRGTRTRARTLK